MVLDKWKFSSTQTKKNAEGDIGNGRNDLKDKGNEQKMLWAKREGRLNRDDTRGHERGPSEERYSPNIVNN